MRSRGWEATPRQRGMPKVAERKEREFALFGGWLERGFDNSDSGQSELLALREQPEELRTAKLPSRGRDCTAGRRARFLIGWTTPLGVDPSQ